MASFDDLDIELNDRPVDRIVYGDPVTEKLVQMVEAVARTPSTVLLTGESGVGKEVFARYVHQKSPRKERDFVAVNCAAIPSTLLESELFGHEKGAFSGAFERHVGLFESGHGGTLFLDEITEMPLDLQAKLLRVLQDRTIRRVGGTEIIPLDVRIVAASNRNVREAVDDNEFRLDLFYRLNVFPIHIPPLRARRGDIIPLIRAFAGRYAAQFDAAPEIIRGEAIEMLMEHTFWGNIRELMNVLERAMIIAASAGHRAIEKEHIVLDQGQHPLVRAEEDAIDGFIHSESVRFIPGSDPLTDVRMRVIIKTLEHFDGNRTRTAEALGVSLRTIRNKINAYRERGIDVPEA